jgi:hypothetical protein
VTDVTAKILVLRDKSDMACRLLILTLMTLLVAPAQETKVTASARTRVENWNWFGDDPGGAYSFSGTLLRLGITHQRKNHELTLELGAPILAGLPEGSLLGAPQGVLGVGGNYFAANDRSRASAMVFLKQGFYRWKASVNTSVRLGRFEFLDGSEVAPADPVLAVLKRDRIQQRLIGHFLWTHVGRSYDGGQILHKSGAWTTTALAMVPTRGVFQTDGWGWNRTALSYVSTTRATGSGKSVGEVRLFGIYYHDFRHVLKTDNRPVAARQADMSNIRIGSYGAHYLHSWKTEHGNFDLLLWGVAQSGDWGRLSHRAWAGNLEAGWQLPVAPKLKPWLRGGYYRASGDKNPNDSRHGTFFQILPTPRPYARMPFYNGMNSDDRFVTASIKPHARLAVNGEFHHLNLASANDLWYLGGGVFQPWSFGYIGRPANGQRRLANLYDAGVDFTINKNWTVSGYAGWAQASKAIQAIYPRQSSGRLAYLELSWKL